MGPQGDVRVVGCPDMKGEGEEWGEEKRGGKGGLEFGKRQRGNAQGERVWESGKAGVGFVLENPLYHSHTPQKDSETHTHLLRLRIRRFDLKELF